MDDRQPEIVIIKRIRNHDDEHHGGAWKIAFADFMTAMMAFFLVLWIINATDKNTKSIVAHYFNAVKLEDPSRARKGIREDTTSSSDADTLGEGTTGAPAAAADAKQADPKPVEHAASNQNQAPASDNAVEPNDRATPKAHFSESTLFKDPYASLDKIVKSAPGPSTTQVTDTSQVAPATNIATLGDFRDPFKPIATGGDRNSASEPKADRLVVAERARDAASKSENVNSPHSTPGKPASVIEDQSKTSAHSEPSSQNAIIAGMPPNASPAPSAQQAASLPVASPHPRPAAPAKNAIAQLSKDLVEQISGITGTQPGPGVEIKATDDGVLISLTDQLNFSMFAIGSAEPQPEVVRIMVKIAQTLKNQSGNITVRGFTDGRPYKSATYDNWRLSSARAQMAYYMLVHGGLPETRVTRIEGYADRQLKNTSDPNAAENRRIEILLSEQKP